MLELVIRAKDAASIALKKVSAGIKGLDRASDAAAASSGRLSAGIDRTRAAAQRFGAVVKGFVLFQLGRLFLGANTAAQSLAKGLELVTGSAEAAAAEMRFVRETANRLGIDVAAAGRAYLDLAAAAKGTALEGEQTRRIFTSISRAMGRLGKSAADTEGALLAVQQMISKGQVSAEELRGQLGERLPGAFQAAARAMGVTTAELEAMLQSGTLVAEELLPKLADELDRTFDTGERINTFTAAWARFKNTVSGAFQAIEGASGIMGALGTALDAVGTTINFVVVGFVTLAEKTKAAAAAVGALWDLLSRRTGLLDFRRRVKEAFEEADRSIAAAADKAFGLDRNLQNAGASGKRAGADIEAGMSRAGDAIRGAMEKPPGEQQNSVFAWMMQELRTLTTEGIPGFVARLAEMRAANLLTDGQVDALRIALVELQGQIQNTGGEVKVTIRKETIDGVTSFSDATGGIKPTADAAAEGAENLGDETEKAGGKAQGAAEAQKGQAVAVKEAGDATEAATGQMSGAASIMAVMIAVIGHARESMAAMSQGALEMFNSLMHGWISMKATGIIPRKATDEIKNTAQEIRRLEKEIMFVSSGIGEWFKAIELNMAKTKKAFLEQEKSAEAMIGRMAKMEGSGRGVVDQAQAIVNSYELLDAQTLGNLQSEIDRLTAANERMNESAERALQRYQDEADPEGAAARRLARERTDLEEQYQAAVAAGNIEAQRMLEEAMRFQREAHAEKMQQIEAEGDARRRGREPNRTLPASPISAGGDVGRLPGAPLTTLPAGHRQPSDDMLAGLEELFRRWRPTAPIITLDGDILSKNAEMRMRRSGGVVAEARIADAATALGHRV